ncbi:serine/threonine-protein kinase [Synechococcus sp. PCC 7336]|uniref:serine/threonine-protein kinase n=1 Tax=Synechococcus sp. PCC 7336 TaxID=195250 RepID=UPI0003489D34|nr:serine/threonine-protein kinase [Synechococcus sp. PCC 7336]
MLLSNRYRVIQNLGEGGFGKTYLGEDTQLPSKPRCVIKELKPLPNVDVEQVLKRFEQEAATLDKLGQHHPQIPQLYAYFAERDKFYLVQEYIEGQTLAAKIATSGPSSEMEAYRLLVQTLPVLCYIHREGVIHRDIKPDNIILRASDGVPVLIDFGAVKETLGQPLTGDGTAASRSITIGTLGFMSAEQAIGRPVFSSDLFSLGMTAIYTLTARGPQSLPTNPSTGAVEWRSPKTNINVSPQLSAVLNKAIQPLQSDRYSSADEMLGDLQQSLGTATVPPTTFESDRSTIPPTIAETSGIPATTLDSDYPAAGVASAPAPPANSGESNNSSPIAPGNIPYRPPAASPSGSQPHSSSPSTPKLPRILAIFVGTPVLLALALIAIVRVFDRDNGDVVDNFDPIKDNPDNNNPSLVDPFAPEASACGFDYCDISVNPGFQPDPQVGTGVVGGPMAANQIVGVVTTPTGKCTGFVDTTPDHAVNLQSPFTYLAIGVESSEETSIAIVAPDGSALCFSGLNPYIEGPWAAGRYEVYVGNLLGSGTGPRYRLLVTEINPGG